MTDIILKLNNKIDRKIDALIFILDELRHFFLRLTLQNKNLRRIYSNYQYRTLTSLVVLMTFIFPISILHPDILLIMGPLIFGYPHMIASYRYLIRRDFLLTKNRSTLFIIFCSFTILTIFIYNFELLQSWMSFSVWPQALSLIVLTLAYFLNVNINRKDLIYGIFISIFFCIFAWQEPLLYAGAILMLHNFIAFFHWILNCQNKSQRQLALASTLVFFVIHIVVLFGAIDSFLDPILLNQRKLENIAWFLASWSDDQLVWYRWLVLYTFGLSVHYFIWLRAIPETELKSLAPLSFRLSLKEWQKDLGPSTLKIVIFICIFGFGLWLFRFELGKSVYFQIALLHGALEMAFLPSKINYCQLND